MQAMKKVKQPSPKKGAKAQSSATRIANNKVAEPKDGYIVSYRIDPDKEVDPCGYIPVMHDHGQFYQGSLELPGQWRALGTSPNPDGKKFPKNEMFTINLISRDKTMKLAWVVAFAPRPRKEYSKGYASPFKTAILRNEDGSLVKASKKPDSNGDYHYKLTSQKMENGGRFLFAIYATVVSGNGKGKAFAVDPEMEVSEI